MKKVLLTILMLPSLASAASVFDSHTWYYGGKTLSTGKHEPVPFNGHTYEFSLQYTSPRGTRASTDMCELSSLTSLNCITNESVAYNEKDQSVHLQSYSEGGINYYEKGQEPKASQFSGTWVREKPTAKMLGCYRNDLTKLVVPYIEKGATDFDNVEEFFQSGYWTSHLYIVKNKYTGQLALSPDRNSTAFANYYLYDADNKPIADMADLDKAVKINDSQSIYRFSAECNLVKSQN